MLFLLKRRNICNVLYMLCFGDCCSIFTVVTTIALKAKFYSYKWHQMLRNDMFLQFTNTAMKDTLKDDGKGSIEKLNKINNDIESIFSKKKIPDVTTTAETSEVLDMFIPSKEQNFERMSRSVLEVTLFENTLEHDSNDSTVRVKTFLYF